MLADGGEIVKVADFGLALDTSDTTMYHSGEAGTPVYTAPEMIKGEKYSYPADCFSFGRFFSQASVF
jgi:serine/threonine protein kinase